jgi:hypothetical protein
VRVLRENPYVHISWLARLLAGDSHCLWAGWFRAHYREYDRALPLFDRVAWQLDHTALLRSTVAELEAEGYQVLIERQNDLRVKGSGGITVHGTPDLLGLRDGAGLVVDTKVGKPRQWHQVQVMLYMWAIPFGLPSLRQVPFDGRLVYRDCALAVAAAEITDTFRRQISDLVHIVGGPEPPRAVPSEWECRYCNIAATECAQRLETSLREGEPEECDEF